jgi:glycosyltransferase involved in cell wall biosynthesis
MALPEAEFILVDDGSTDDTMEIADSLQRRYGEDRVIVIPLSGNQGAQIARNHGIDRSRGEFILFCDSDDVLVASGVKSLADALTRTPRLDYAYGKVVMTDATLVPLVGMEPIGGSFQESSFEMAGYHWHTMGALYRKSYLKKIGPWNPDLTGSQDWEYQARVKLGGGKGLFIDTLVGSWRQHEEGRVGTRKFRPDYIRSVVTACDVILAVSIKEKKCDRSLKRRLAKKLIIHGLECGEARDAELHVLCFIKARHALHQDVAAQGCCTLLALVPLFLNGVLKRVISRH